MYQVWYIRKIPTSESSQNPCAFLQFSSYYFVVCSHMGTRICSHINGQCHSNIFFFLLNDMYLYLYFLRTHLTNLSLSKIKKKTFDIGTENRYNKAGTFIQRGCCYIVVMCAAVLLTPSATFCSELFCPRQKVLSYSVGEHVFRIFTRKASIFSSAFLFILITARDFLLSDEKFKSTLFPCFELNFFRSKLYPKTPPLLIQVFCPGILFLYRVPIDRVTPVWL